MKPKVICHVMASVDGHLQVERWSAPLKEGARGDLMKVYPDIARSLGTDAWTFGRNTVRDIFPEKFERRGELMTLPRTFFAKRRSERLFISFDPESDIAYSASQLRGDDILAILPLQTATEAYLAFLCDNDISYIVVSDFTDLRSILEAINERFGVKSISLQGGGKLDGGMLNSGVIDELSLVIYPGLDCRKDSVAIFDDTDTEAIARTRLELIGVEAKDHGAVWLRYKLHTCR